MNRWALFDAYLEKLGITEEVQFTPVEKLNKRI